MRKPGKARRFFGNLLIILTVAFTVYLSVIMVRRINAVVLKDSYVTIFKYELIICAVLMLLALDVRFRLLTKTRAKLLKAVGWLLRIALVAAVGFVLFIFAKIAIGGTVITPGTAENAIVLGLALQNGQPTPDLIDRVDAAAEFSRANPDATLILTGGNPDATGKTEAAVMRDLLTERGIKEDRMVLEDQAATTIDNFRNVAQITDPSRSVVLISSDYHMYRAARTAEEAGFVYVIRKPAPSSRVEYVANVMWEVIHELNRLKSGI
ncbi:MAG: YdcF family protein [Lachnospiraceae bacterium]|nr:YdcF family protein [Lachnospiraceae bacterium]